MSNMSEMDILTSEVAAQIIRMARSGGNTDPIVWVTGNAMMPPARWFDAMEAIWQADCYRGEPIFEWVWEQVERKVAAANVYLDCPDYDNSLYAVDMNRWQHRYDDDVYDGYAEYDNLQDEWEYIGE